ncbi:helix-turn-helix transcriptional regulator [Facklamia sp. DSM 111018]|uniref:Helix-turn-helix transcriptional regulator n=1 Tax=Facklamia lactis TaxID=2749967 RepID=A0ABS0LSP0_9LACT|nr:helix-turn-helix transcriptional regulator [Facklamia lactis]MBG9980661.1 helix-turn-helix transcriptional regulator [Facklamia lactis]MBG9986475.1 helix-turn-helix transcriptional regulator [Facklamia lactis]
MKFTPRQEEIVDIVKNNEPISGDEIAKKLGLTKSTLRSDFAVLTMTGILDARQKVGYIYSGLAEQSLLAESLSQYLIKDHMIQAITANPDMTVNDAITQLFMYDAGSLYVVDPENNQLAGVVSRKDLLRSIIGQTHNTTLAIIMTRMPNIIVAQPNQSILDAAKLIAQHQIDSLPIVTPNYEILGKLSKSNIVNLLVEICQSEV